MARAKRIRTPEQIEADRARMQKVRESRQNKNPKTDAPKIVGAEELLSINEEALPEQEVAIEQPIEPAPKPDTVVQPDYGDLVRQIQELKDNQFMMMRDALLEGKSKSSDVAVRNGQMTGTVEKYILDPANYPDPRERLATEPQLQRFAFSLNYELYWEIGESRYETIDHIRTAEPKFTLTLTKIMTDEYSGADTGGRYDIARIIMHEDPTTAIIIARQLDMEVNTEDEKAFLDEMRYIRLREWLVGCFFPPAPTAEKNKRDMAIDGKIVQYWEKNVDAHSGQQGLRKTDWDNLPKIKF